MTSALAVETDYRPRRPLPVSPRGKSKTVNYEATIQRILRDKTGQRTWGELELLEKESRRDSKARKALNRLDALFQTREFLDTKDKAPGPRDLAGALDASDSRTQQQCWKHLFSADRTQATEALKESRSSVGGRVLGLPPGFGGTVGPRGEGSLETTDNWSRLLDGTLAKRLRSHQEDPRLKEYGKLYQAYQQAQKGELSGKVSEVALYLDVKEMEETLLPEHVQKARREVRQRVLGDEAQEALPSRSQAHRLLGAASGLPSHSRERFLYEELSAIAIAKPKDLPFYAQTVLQELRHCPDSVSNLFLPKFHRALTRVKRVHAGHLQGQSQSDTESFRGLLRSLSLKRQEEPAAADQVEYYRSKLTFNGCIRNYTYL